MKIGIVGLGLIGGSLGLDWRSQGHCIIGISRKEQTCNAALAKGVADQASTNLKLLSDVEIVVICTPIGAIVPTVEQAIPHLNPKTIITDVGSVKEPIVTACNALWQNFIGGHPMAGTAESGIDAALPNLFGEAAYVFTPTRQNKPEDVEKLKALAYELNAIPYVCEPPVHDRAVSLISHLPVMIGTGLISTCLQADSDTLKLAQILASSGFKDTSRVGGGNPELGVMIAKYNREELLRSLYSYRNNLDKIVSLIEGKKWQDLEQMLEDNGEQRPRFLN